MGVWRRIKSEWRELRAGDVCGFPCAFCGRPSFTIRNQCRRCAPDLHRRWRDASAVIAEADRAFQKRTGKRALASWAEFETFLDQSYADEMPDLTPDPK